MSLDAQISDVITAIGGILKGKQNKLISGDSIKTINNQSLLGSGNITISGAGGTQNVFIQESEPTPGTGENVLWIQKSSDGRVTFNLVEGL